MRCETYRMEDVLESLIDYRGKTPRKSDTGIMTLSAKSVRDGYIDYSKCYCISPDEYKKFMVRGFPEVGDVLLTTEAPLGTVARLDRDDVAIAQRLLTLRGKKGVLDTGYLYYYLRSATGQAKLREKETGTTVTGIKQAEFRKILIDLPDINTQEKIAAILSPLDDKIDLNRRINANLEEQAQAIWDSWFRNFEPFGGIMPDDWKYATLGDVTENLRERIRENNYPVFSAVSSGDLVLSDDFFSKRVYSKNISGYIIVNENNFAYNPARINIGSIGINDFGYKGCVSPAYVVIKVPEEYEGYFYFYFKSKRFRAESSLRASGTVRQTLNYSDFALIEIIYPSREYAEKFNRIYKTVSNAKKAYENETQKLIEIRDTLIPKLISGEIIP